MYRLFWSTGENMTWRLISPNDSVTAFWALRIGKLISISIQLRGVDALPGPPEPRRQKAFPLFAQVGLLGEGLTLLADFPLNAQEEITGVSDFSATSGPAGRGPGRLRNLW
jgi:hypothetical protein